MYNSTDAKSSITKKRIVLTKKVICRGLELMLVVAVNPSSRLRWVIKPWSAKGGDRLEFGLPRITPGVLTNK